jgi:hypothetical protein
LRRRGGEATPANIALRCRSHNQYEARQVFGPSSTAEPRAAYSATDPSRAVVPADG